MRHFRFNLICTSLNLLLVTQYALQLEENSDSRAVITKYVNVPPAINDNSKLYEYEYETSNNIKANEYAYFNTGPKGDALIVFGRYSYIGPDGVLYEVEYIADENGFRPIGKHIPGAAMQPSGQHYPADLGRTLNPGSVVG